MKTIYIRKEYGCYFATTNDFARGEYITSFQLKEPFQASIEFLSATSNMVGLKITVNDIEFEALTSANLLVEFINTGNIEGTKFNGMVQFIKRGSKVLLSPC